MVYSLPDPSPGTRRDSSQVSPAAAYDAARVAILDLESRVGVVEGRQFVVGPGEGDYDTVQAAIDACNAEYLDSGQRGWVFVSGQFEEQVTLKQGVAKFTGMPYYSSLALPDAANGALLTTDGFTTADTIDGSLWGFILDALRFDGNKANQSGMGSDSGLVQLHAFRYVLGNSLEIYNAAGVGLYSTWSSWMPPVEVDGFPVAIGMEAEVGHISVHHCDGHGVQWMGPHDSTITKAHSFFNDGGAGFYVSGRAYGTVFTDCHTYGNDQTYSMHVNEVTGIQITGGHYEGAINAQIKLQSSTPSAGASITVSNAYIFAANAVSCMGIEIDGPFAYNITGNKFANCVAGSIVFTNDGGGGTVANNTLYQESGDAWGGTSPAADTDVKPHRVSGGATGGFGSTHTIASGAISAPVGGGMFKVATENGDATDDLQVMTVQGNGTVTTLTLANIADVPTIKNAVGGSDNILINGDYVLDTYYKSLTLVARDGFWTEVSRV